MKKLWKENQLHHPLVNTYCFSVGATVDNALVVSDVWGSIAHAATLERIGILTHEEFQKLQTQLLSFIDAHRNGTFVVTTDDEDVHTKLETALTASLGELGAKIHLGRSRNDQVLTALRLFTKQQLLEVAHLTGECIDTFLTHAARYEFIPMPGFTHMQRAMPSSVGMWLASFAEGLLDDLAMLKAAYALNDQSPLGSGASYGVPLSLDREHTATLLGFAKVQRNALACQASRVKIQYAVLASLHQIMLTLARFAQDLLLFTTAEFGFFTVAPTLCTGSSIMPQKQNLDVMEILRARVHVVSSNAHLVAAIGENLPSGYNADVAETKRPLLESLKTVVDSLKVIVLTVSSMTPNGERMRAACTPEIFATHAAFELARNGIPFREAYRRVAEQLTDLKLRDPVAAIQQMVHIGAPGNLGLLDVVQELKRERQWWESQRTTFQSVMTTLTRKEQI